MPPRSKPMSRSAGPKSKPRKPKPRSTANDFPEESRQEMRQRSKGICEAGTRRCTGKASQFHHRKLRRHKDQRSCNGLHVCDDCHVEIHACGLVAYAMGWLVRSFMDPAVVPVKPGERYREFH